MFKFNFASINFNQLNDLKNRREDPDSYSGSLVSVLGEPKNVFVVPIRKNATLLIQLSTVRVYTQINCFRAYVVLKEGSSLTEAEIKEHVKVTPNPICYTDRKENKIFLIYKEIQKGAVAKSCMTNFLLIVYMTKYLRISSYIRN